jgi:hypothetical protein
MCICVVFASVSAGELDSMLSALRLRSDRALFRRPGRWTLLSVLIDERRLDPPEELRRGIRLPVLMDLGIVPALDTQSSERLSSHGFSDGILLEDVYVC